MIYIEHYIDLLERIDEQKKKCPIGYTDIDTIRRRLEKEEFSPVGHKFGISVSRCSADESYGFEIDKQTPTNTYILFLGVWQL